MVNNNLSELKKTLEKDIGKLILLFQQKTHLVVFGVSIDGIDMNEKVGTEHIVKIGIDARLL